MPELRRAEENGGADCHFDEFHLRKKRVCDA
jgi:hypothetical protein